MNNTPEARSTYDEINLHRLINRTTVVQTPIKHLTFEEFLEARPDDVGLATSRKYGISIQPPHRIVDGLDLLAADVGLPKTIRTQREEAQTL